MSDDFQDKLAALKTLYTKNLPEKITAILTLWKTFKQKPQASLQLELHTKIHGMKGSSRIYGFQNIGEISEKLETIFNSLPKDTKLTAQQLQELESLFKMLKDASLTPDEEIGQIVIPDLQEKVDDKKVATSGLKQVFFFAEKDPALDDEKLALFGYKSEFFSNLFAFTKALQARQPQLLVIDIEQTIDLNKEETQELKKNYLKDIPVVFLSRTSEFNYRLRAVELNAQAFILKPFAIEELVAELNRIIQMTNYKYRVLIVDDEIEVANYYATILDQAGMLTSIITKASDIDRALHEFKPDLIMSDFHMPECDGLELATIIRQQKLYESIPFIFLSSEGDKLVQLKAMSSGADDFITKGDQPAYLILAIKNKANRYRRLQGLMVEDNLTGALNHTAILNLIESEIKSGTSASRFFCVALITLDDFANLNKQYGPAAGDQVLKTISFILKNKLRPKDSVGRFTHEEFLVLLPDISLEKAVALLDGIRNGFSSTSFWWDYRMFSVTFSACVVSFADYKTAAQLINAATLGLKQMKRNMVVSFSEKLPAVELESKK